MEEASSELPNLTTKNNERTQVSFNYDLPKKKSGMTTIVLVIIVIALLLAGGFFFRSKISSIFQGASAPTPSPEAVETPQPSPTPTPLVRADWNFEVLNGSGSSGLAKKIAGQLQDLGYQVVKTGNADKNNYAQTEILVREDYLEKIDLVIADLKDTIKIASVAGELEEGTASARIIIGKDSI